MCVWVDGCVFVPFYWAPVYTFRYKLGAPAWGGVSPVHEQIQYLFFGDKTLYAIETRREVERGDVKTSRGFIVVCISTYDTVLL